jgi:type IV secretion system protein VirB9
MTKIPAAFLALALFSSPALASTDSRLQSVHYEADEVVTVKGRLGYQSMIEFAQGEQIENVAVGDSSAWQVTPNKRANLLFLKPLMAGAKTNMTVVTDQRTYLFDLSVASGGSAPLYNLRFTYGPKPQQPRIAYPNLLPDAPAAATSPPQRVLPAAAPAVAQRRLNFDWKGKGDKQLLPARYYDDGRSVYLQWKPGVPMPALFDRDEKGREGLLNFRLVGNFIVVDQVPRTLVMRLGKDEAVLINRNPPKTIRIAGR